MAYIQKVCISGMALSFLKKNVIPTFLSGFFLVSCSREAVEVFQLVASFYL